MDDRLDAALRDLGRAVEFPPTPDLRGAVTERLRRSSEPGAMRWRDGWPVSWPSAWPGTWPRALVLAAVATLLVVATAAALVLVLPGLRITIVPAVPTPTVTATASRLALGEPVAVAAIDASMPAALGAPDEAYRSTDGTVVSLVYRARPDLPELSPGSGVGLLLQQIGGTLDRERVDKLVAEGASVTAVEVGGEPGFWIEGPPHLVHYTDMEGVTRAEMTRLVGDTLVWDRGGILFRIESGLGRDATVRIAESIVGQ
jgi:hypothetical protein